MSQVPILFLADSFMDQVNAATQDHHIGTHELLLAASIALGLGALLFVVVYFRFRTKRLTTDQQRLTPRTSSSGMVSGKDAAEDEPEQRRRRRKRRRRRDHRPRNPSLEQTGGLPPPRPEGELPKY